MPAGRRSRSGDYVVGFARPPKTTQFHPGHSGNPRGRPKGTKGVADVLQRLVLQKVPVSENGKTRKMSALEVMLRRLLTDAMRGEGKAIKLVLSITDRYLAPVTSIAQDGDLQLEDREILARYLEDSAAASERVRNDAEVDRNDP